MAGVGGRYVGIKVLDVQGSIPYEAYVGFSQEFWESENWPSVRWDRCTGGRQAQPQESGCMTPLGSFYCGNILECAAGLSEECASFRGVCVGSGFASVAVVPLRWREKILGAVHLADEREGMVPRDVVESLELIAPIIGEAVHRFEVETELQRSFEMEAALNALLRLSLGDIPLEGFSSAPFD